MGRLTLNIPLSFAQFEREFTGERIRDKIAASKRKGLWMGGVTPLGYEVKDQKLVPVPTEADTVRSIYARYLELGDRRGVRSKVRVHSDGTRTGGNSFSRGALYALLSNPIYIGEISHKRVRHPGQHPAIIERSVWDAVQQKLREQGPGPLDKKTSPSPLMGKLFDSAGGRLSPSHASKGGRRYRYYVSTDLMTGTLEEPGGWRLPASQLETWSPMVQPNASPIKGRSPRLSTQLGFPPGGSPRHSKPSTSINKSCDPKQSGERYWLS
jgi:hypothetical protein